MNYRLEVLPVAHGDVEAAAEHIAHDNPDAASRFLDAVEATYRDLFLHPDRWPIYRLPHPQLADVRKRAVIDFGNYLVFYRMKKDTVQIIRVLHGARDIPSILSD